MAFDGSLCDDVLPRIRAGLSVQETGGEAVILDRASGRVHQLNSTAYFVWQHLDGQCRLAALAELMVASLEVELGRATQDIRQLVKELGQQGLVEETPSAHKDVTI